MDGGPVFCDLEGEYISPYQCGCCDNRLSNCIGSDEDGDLELDDVEVPKKVHFRCNSWRPEEDKIVITMYPAAKREDILEALPNRSWTAVYTRASYLKVQRRSWSSPRHNSWNHEDQEFLRKNFPWAPDEFLEKGLGRNIGPIKAQAHKLGLKRLPYYIRLNIMKNQKM